jgi:hypothetical protein
LGRRAWAAPTPRHSPGNQRQKTFISGDSHVVGIAKAGSTLAIEENPVDALPEGWTKINMRGTGSFSFAYASDLTTKTTIAANLVRLIDCRLEPTNDKDIRTTSLRIKEISIKPVNSVTFGAPINLHDKRIDLSEIGPVLYRKPSFAKARLKTALVSVKIGSYVSGRHSDQEAGQLLFLKSMQIGNALNKAGFLTSNISITLPLDPVISDEEVDQIMISFK